jgi:hypothetical protein
MTLLDAGHCRRQQNIHMLMFLQHPKLLIFAPSFLDSPRRALCHPADVKASVGAKCTSPLAIRKGCTAQRRKKNSRLAPLPGLPRNSWVSRSRCCIISILNCAKNVPRSTLYLPPFLVFFFTPPPKRMAFEGLGAALRFAILDFLSARSAFCFVTLRSLVVVLVRGAPLASSSCITSASASADRAPARA